MHMLKTGACAMDDDDEKAGTIKLINATDERISNYVSIMREGVCSQTAFKLMVKWFEHG